MNIGPLHAKFTRASLIAAALTIPNVHAEVWDINSAGQWGDSSNWSGGTVPNAVDAVADFRFDHTGGGTFYGTDSPTISPTIGSIYWENTDTSTGNTLLTLSGGGGHQPITFDVSTGSALVDVAAGHALSARAGVVLNDDLVKTGGGTFNVSNNSNISGTGGITVSEGTVQFNRPALYTGVTTVNDGAALFLNNSTFSSTNLILNGIGNDTNSQGTPYGALRSNGANITGTIELASDTAIYLNGNTNTEFRGVVSGSGGLTVGTWPTNNPNLFLLADNTYAGETVLNQQADLHVGNGGTAGSLGTGAVNITGPTDTVNGATLRFNRSDNIAVDNNITVDGTLRNDGTGLELNGVLSGSGTIVQSGSYTNIDGANTFDGNIQVDSGILRIRGGATYDGDFAVSSGAELEFGYSGSAAAGDKVVNGVISGDGVVDISNNFSSSATEKVVFTGVNTYTGGTSINNADILEVGGAAGALGTGDVAVNSGGTLSFNRTASGTIDNNIAVNGTMSVDGASGVEFNGDLSGSGTIVKSATASYLNLDGANTFTGDIDLQGGTTRIRGGATYAGDISLASGAVLDFAYSSTAASGDVTVSGNISGDGAVEVSNNSFSTTRQAILAGANTYTGGTTIESTGILQVNGGGTLGTGDVTLDGGSLNAVTAISNTVNIIDESAISGNFTGIVDTGTSASRAINTTGGLTAGTLTGQGSFSNGLVIIATAHNPGNSPGTQTFNDGLQYADSSSLTLEIAADGLSFDQLFVNGGLEIGNEVSLGINLFGSADYGAAFWDSNQAFTLITTDGYTGDFGSVSLSGLGSAPGEGSWTSDWVGNNYVANWAAVPEPRGAAMIGAFGVFALLRRRR